MAWTVFQLLLSVLLVTTGSINTLCVKWADRMTARDRDGKERHFNHPFFQALAMFVGEFFCFVLYHVLLCCYAWREEGLMDTATLTRGTRAFNHLVLAAPAFCDMVATSMMYVGLNFTFASSFQMLRGAVIVFTGLLSFVFLGRVLRVVQWLGIFTIVAGLTLVGLSDYIAHESGDRSLGSVLLGDTFIVAAQVVAAAQFVIEEKFMSGLDIAALNAVGWEGIFGFSVMSILLVPMYYIKVTPPFSDNSRGVLEDALEAYVQMGNNLYILLAMGVTMVSIAVFNFAGISITKELSAVTRMVLDSIRTLVIWMWSLIFFDQKFHWLQLIGFACLIIGMLLYNQFTPAYCCPKLTHKATCETCGSD